MARNGARLWLCKHWRKGAEREIRRWRGSCRKLSPRNSQQRKHTASNDEFWPESAAEWKAHNDLPNPPQLVF